MAAVAHATSSIRRERPVELSGHVFGHFTVLILLALVAIAAWHRQTAIVTLLGLTLATIGVSRLWSRLSLRRIGCERSLSARALFPGEELLITIRLSNQKALPLPWVEITQPVPPRLWGPTADGEGWSGILSRSLTMPWYSRITWRQPVAAHRRGYYVIPPVSITSGDILGLYPRISDASSFEHVSVYPRIYPVRHLPLQRTDATGELQGRTSLQEDPTRMRGIRDYHPGDGFRRMHWKASARHRDLKVKLYEPAALSRVNLILAADSFDAFDDSEPFELAASTVASIARYCVENQMQFGFLSNSRLVADQGRARLAPGSGNAQLISLLEILARATPSVDRPFHMLARELQSLARSGAGLIIITGHLQEAHIAECARLGRTRCSLLVLEVGGTTGAGTMPFPHRTVGGPADLLAPGGV